MTDEMTVQTKSSVTPIVAGGVLGAGAGAGATFIPKIKDYISEPPKYKSFDDIVKETSNNDNFEKIMDEAGLDDAKKSEIKEKIKTANETNSQTVEDAKKAVDDAKMNANNVVEKAIKDSVEPTNLTDAEKSQLKLKQFIEKNKGEDGNLSNDVKKFIKDLKAAGSDEKKINDLKKDSKNLYEKYESISLESLDGKSKDYLKKLRTVNELKKEGSGFQDKINELKSAKTKLEEAVKVKEDSIKNALEPHKDDFAKLLERGKKSWGKVTAIIAGGLVVGSIIGSLFRSKNEDIA